MTSETAELSPSSTDFRYPIGRLSFTPAAEITPAHITRWIDDIAALPAAMRAATEGLTPAQLDTPYRDGGWTVRQVVHHVPDSHMNGYTRFRLALTEETPQIKPYHEEEWAKLPDTFNTPIDVSLTLLEALHTRWVNFLRNLRETDLQRGVFHPHHNRVLSVTELLELYAWHGKHHVAHITSLRERKGWK
jgi:hypothetical protein